MLTFEQKVGLICVVIIVVVAAASLIAMRLVDKRNIIVKPESEESYKKRMALFDKMWEMCCTICGSTNIRTDHYRYSCRDCGSFSMGHRRRTKVK